MGTMQHDAMLIDVWQRNALDALKDKLSEIELPFLEHKAEINGHSCIIIPPDGSKEGWDLSNAYDKKRELLKEFLKSKDTKEFYFTWIHVRFGEEGNWLEDDG